MMRGQSTAHPPGSLLEAELSVTLFARIAAGAEPQTRLFEG